MLEKYELHNSYSQHFKNNLLVIYKNLNLTTIFVILYNPNGVVLHTQLTRTQLKTLTY